MGEPRYAKCNGLACTKYRKTADTRAQATADLQDCQMKFIELQKRRVRA